MEHKIIEGNIVDVHARCIFPGRICIEGGRIVLVEAVSSNESDLDNESDLAHEAGLAYGAGADSNQQRLEPVPHKDSNGLPYIMPGFVDSHIHIESTLMVPENYARLAVENGIVAAVCDPHEIANVMGMEGIDYMVDNGRRVRFNFCYMAPSCVPSTPFELAGATVDSDQIRQLLVREEIAGLAEMMNVPGVVYGDSEVLAKIQAAKDAGKPIDGHAPKVEGDMLRKYVDAGISTDHECSTLDEARQKIELGVKVLIREGSAACDFEHLYPLVKEYPGMTMFCSDDMYPDDVATIGYVNGMVKRAIGKGMPLWETLECACVTPVKHYGLGNGLLRVGDSADFIIVKDLKDFAIQATYIQGVEVYNASEGVTGNIEIEKGLSDGPLPNKFNAKEVAPDSLAVKWCDKPMKVITANEGSLITGMELVRPMADSEGNVMTDAAADIAKIVVCDRYNGGRPQVAFINGFNIKRGAIASTIAHDCHNIVAIGCSDADLAAVINRLIKEKGGMVVYDGKEMACLPLPVAGLMNVMTPEETAGRHVVLRKNAKEIGCTFNAPFMTMTFMALSVIPDLKLTHKGLFDGKAFEFTSLWGNGD